MRTLTTDILANATTADLIAFRRILAPRTLSHGSSFAVKQYRARIAEIDAEMSRRSNVLSINA
jgi:hypothetical protein